MTTVVERRGVLPRALAPAMLRSVGAVLLLLGGAVHLQQWFRNYRDLDIGPTFVANTLVSVLVATVLFAAAGRVARWAAFGGIAVSLASLGALLASRTIGLPGFTAVGYDRPEIEAIVVELLAAVVLGAAWWRSRAAENPTPRSDHDRAAFDRRP
jgi:hypothetical protein